MVATLSFLLCLASAVADYGLDYSFPMTNFHVKEHGRFAGKQELYENYMAGCRALNPPKVERDTSRDPCAEYEFDRLDMIRHQPKAMQVCRCFRWLSLRCISRKISRLILFFYRNYRTTLPQDMPKLKPPKKSWSCWQSSGKEIKTRSR